MFPVQIYFSFNKSNLKKKSNSHKNFVSIFSKNFYQKFRRSIGELVTDESEIREVWSSYFEKLLNEEFEWNRDFLKDWQEDESSTAESAELITEQEVKLAIKQMKKGKAAGPSGVTAEMFASGWRSRNKMGDGDL